MRTLCGLISFTVVCLTAFPASAPAQSAVSSPRTDSPSSGPAIASSTPAALTLVYPSEGARDVPTDTQIHLRFSAPVAEADEGAIRVTDATGHEVARISLGEKLARTTIGGFEGYQYLPVIIDGDTATITLPRGTLERGKGYTVAVPAGAFPSGGSSSAALTARFETRTEALSPGKTRLVVAPDGAGDFATIQAALDYVPEHNTTPITIEVHGGVYREIVAFAHKDHVTLRGEDRQGTILEYRTNDKLNPTGGNPYGGANTPDHESRTVYHRGVLLAHRDSDFTLENLTIRNLTPHGGSQSECIIFNGTDSARAIVRDVDLQSFQDTLQINGQAYVANSKIEGDVDFMWGTGACFFENCTARSLRSGAYYTQIRNPGTKHGFVYYHCTFDGAAGVTGNYLSRIEPGRFPHSEVVLIDCTLGPAVGALGWQLQGKNAPATAPVHFWEYGSHAPDGTPVDVSRRHKTSRQLHEPEDAALIKEYSDPTWVLGGDWNPRS